MIATGQLEQNLYRMMTSVTFDDFGRAAGAFTDTYKSFATQVTSGTGGRPTQVEAGAAQLRAVLAGAYGTKSLSGTAQVLATGLVAFWQMQTWAGGCGPGNTTHPGYTNAEPALVELYSSGTSQGQPTFHARELAKICSMGVREVVITEYPPGDSPKITTAV